MVDLEESASHPSPPPWRGAPSLWIDQFVWARGFCETRISCCASVDCSGTIGKIHVREIRVRQGGARACYHDDFMIWGHLTRLQGSFRAQGFALTRNVARSHGSKNLLQRAILYRHQEILLRQGRLQAQTQENYM